ncbi:MAG: oligosaccharide flippase family protein [Bacteroidota bacterium]|nr:oligosaccharide flippase family protein [Bacteroidota bacterium]
MQIIKKLAGQTAIYGLSSMLGRFVNFLLVIPHTAKLSSVGAYGDITAIFAMVAFLNIVLTYGLETSYFNFIRNGNNANKVFATLQKSIMASTAVFSLLVLIFLSQSAVFLGFEGRSDYVWCCLIFLVFDTVSALPYARLRHEERPLKFASIKLINIGVNVGLNLLFLMAPPVFLQGYTQVTLVLIANAVASIVSFLMLLPIVLKINITFDWILYKQVLKYTWPLVFIGLAGIVNETLDRTLLIRLLPAGEGSYQNGIYGAFYKLTMVMTMFVQAYKFAAEPFFFKQKDNQDSRVVYAEVMFWFVAVCSLIFLVCMMFIEPLAHLFIKNKAYFDDLDGLFIVPVLLLANLFLGIYYNLSIWYKLSNNTKIGALVSIIAALITIVSNVYFIPIYGFLACAFITLIVYFLMCIAAYILGNRYFKIPYQPIKYLALIAISFALYLMSSYVEGQISVIFWQICIKIIIVSFLVLIIWMLKPKTKNNKFANQSN